MEESSKLDATTQEVPLTENKDSKETKESEITGFPIFIKTCGESKANIQLQVTGVDNIQDIKQYLFESLETCYVTNYDLYVEKTKLNEFAEIHDFPQIQANTTLEMVEGFYDERSIRLHVRRLRDILSSNDQAHSLSFFSSLSKEDEPTSNSKESKKEKDTEPKIAESDIPTDKGISVLSDYFPSEDKKQTVCLKDVVFSGWNPPPGNRKLHGDLIYLELTTLENRTVFITGWSKGFFINASTATQFNPSPTDKPCSSHTLVGLLNQLSPLFKKNFQIVLQQAFQRHSFEMFPVPYPVYSWAAKKQKHNYDSHRAEETVAFNNDFDFRGQLRDWNEEYQTCKELPRETIQDRITRDRAIFKVNADFVDAAVKGAIAIVDRTVPPLNPLDPERAHMFLYNNIFFSFAFDARDVYKDYGGDKAAHVSVNNDLKGIKLLNTADIKGLYTLATCIVDYRGYRIVGQSIIPGILQREQTSNVVYGSIDNGKSIHTEPQFHDLVCQIAKVLHIKPHKVQDESDNVVSLAAPLESKGIIGTDSRKYLLDLVRFCPRDAYYSGKQNILTILRAELVAAYYEHLRQIEILKKKQERDAVLKKQQEEQQQQTQKQEQQPESQQSIKGEKTEEEKKPEQKMENEPKQTKEDEKKEDEKKEDEKKEDEKKEDEGFEDLEFEFDAFNPNILCEGYKLADAADQITKDENLVKEISKFLVETVIPVFIEELSWLSPLPVDGHTLTVALHNHGINCRYLGKIAELAGRFDLLRDLCIAEMIARSCKHILRSVLRNTNDFKLASAISHIFNCMLGNVKGKDDSSKKNKKKTSSEDQQDTEVKDAFELTSATLWSEIVRDVKQRFNYELPSNRDTLKPIVRSLPMLRAVCQKVGIQVENRDYDYATETPFTPNDILNLYPVVKHTEPQSSDGRNLLEAGKGFLSQGRLDIAYELLTEALAIFHQVYGPIHKDTANCYANLSTVLYHAKDLPQALDHQQKATIINERCLGVDHYETAHSYINLGLISHSMGKNKQALVYLMHALYLIRLISNGKHPDTGNTYLNLGTILQDLHQFNMAIQYYVRALESYESMLGPNNLQTAAIYHAIAIAYSNIGQYKEALNFEKKNYAILHEKVGDEDLRTVESNIYLKQFTAKAVQMQIETKKTQRDITNQLSQVKLDKLRSTAGGISIPQPGKSLNSQSTSSMPMGTRPLNEILSFINGGKPPRTFKERNKNVSVPVQNSVEPDSDAKKKKNKKKSQNDVQHETTQ